MTGLKCELMVLKGILLGGSVVCKVEKEFLLYCVGTDSLV